MIISNLDSPRLGGLDGGVGGGETLVDMAAAGRRCSKDSELQELEEMGFCADAFADGC